MGMGLFFSWYQNHSCSSGSYILYTIHNTCDVISTEVLSLEHYYKCSFVLRQCFLLALYLGQHMAHIRGCGTMHCLTVPDLVISSHSDPLRNRPIGTRPARHNTLNFESLMSSLGGGGG